MAKKQADKKAQHMYNWVIECQHSTYMVMYK